MVYSALHAMLADTEVALLSRVLQRKSWSVRSYHIGSLVLLNNPTYSYTIGENHVVKLKVIYSLLRDCSMYYMYIYQ